MVHCFYISNIALEAAFKSTATVRLSLQQNWCELYALLQTLQYLKFVYHGALNQKDKLNVMPTCRLILEAQYHN